MDLLLALNPPLGYFPDFLTPAEGTRGFEEGLAAVMATPSERVHREMAAFRAAHPAMTYRDGVLEISNYITARELFLNGRGLLLVPSYFKRADKPLVLADPQLPPVLIYPVSPDVRVVTERRHAPLGELLGRTRATVLELAAGGATTSAMASSLGVSAAAVSQHVGLLRENGLIVSVRDRNMVHHGLTARGRALLGD